jgi:ribonuclease R
MLPRELSNEICSLNEGKDRCALTCEMRIDRRGLIKDYDIYASLIHSKKKMNYDDVNSIIERGEIPSGYEPFVDDLKMMQELSHIIRHAREERGASDFDIIEPKIVCDRDGTPTEIIARERGEGEKLIEDFMLAANESVAKALFFNKILGRPSLGMYRVHEYPLPAKIESFTKFVGSLGHPVKGDIKHITYRTISDIISQIEFKNDTEESIIKSMAVRSMPKAFYSEQNLGHYGLALKYYAHFTSPIRRYPDLTVHKLIREFLLNPSVDDNLYIKFANKLPDIGRQSSERERKADEAERECDSMKMAEYMENYIKEHPDEEYNAVVTGVTSFGIFVQLTSMYIEGMISLSTLNGYYTFDEEKQSLSSKGKAPIQLGTELKVKCVSASKETQQVNFEIIKELENKNKNENKEKKLVKDYGRN